MNSVGATELDRWNEVKKKLQFRSRTPYFKQGEIWWVSVGLNLGSESYGKGVMFRRPVLVLKKLSSVPHSFTRRERYLPAGFKNELHR